MKTIKLYVDMNILTSFKQIYQIEELFKEGYFKNLQPNKNIVDTINQFLDINERDVEVFLLSSYLNSKYALNEKNEWLDMYLPKIDHAHRFFIDYRENKDEYMNKIDKSCVLLDEDTDKLLEWKKKGGVAIQLIKPSQTINEWEGKKVDYSLHPKIIYYTIKNIIIEEYIQKRTLKEMIEMTQNVLRES